ncbi:MAG: response regulator [Syntrophobacteraceae bacterium]
MNADKKMFGSKGKEEGKILVMLDEESLAGGLQTTLSEQGYEVDVVMSVQNALEQLHRKNFDLLVVDLCLSETGGMELIRKVRREHPCTEFIVTTSHPSVSSAVEAMKLGAKDYLAEPFTGDELQKIVVSTLRKKGTKASAKPAHEKKKLQVGTLIDKGEVLAVLKRAAKDEQVSQDIMENGLAAHEDFALEAEVKAAIIRGDLEWLDKHLGGLTPKQLTLIKKICKPDS